MKFFKFITLCLFFSIIFTPVFSQETSGSDIDQKPAAEETGAVKQVSEDISVPEDKTGADSVPEKSAEKIPEQKKADEVKESPKSRSVKKTVAGPEKKSEEISAGEPRLLGIDEGNFKYSRIPEIGLNEIKAPIAASDRNSDDPESKGLDREQEAEESGFLGMKKEQLI